MPVGGIAVHAANSTKRETVARALLAYRYGHETLSLRLPFGHC